jgi:hypothetical protein
MNKVTNEVVGAFLKNRKRKVGNTATDGTTLTLHGNLIAQRMPDGSIMATLAGWPTVTTRERLNGLCDLLGLCKGFRQSKFVQYYGDEPIGSNETIVLTRPEGKPVS